MRPGGTQIRCLDIISRVQLGPRASKRSVLGHNNVQKGFINHQAGLHISSSRTRYQASVCKASLAGASRASWIPVDAFVASRPRTGVAGTPRGRRARLGRPRSPAPCVHQLLVAIMERWHAVRGPSGAGHPATGERHTEQPGFWSSTPGRLKARQEGQYIGIEPAAGRHGVTADGDVAGHSGRMYLQPTRGMRAPRPPRPQSNPQVHGPP